MRAPESISRSMCGNRGLRTSWTEENERDISARRAMSNIRSKWFGNVFRFSLGARSGSLGHAGIHHPLVLRRADRHPR